MTIAYDLDYSARPMNLNKLLALLLACAAANAGCVKRGQKHASVGTDMAPSRSSREPPKRQAAAANDELFIYGELTKTAAPEPPRFTAPLPTTLAELQKVNTYPPRSQLANALCRSDERARARYLQALRAAAARGPIDGQLEDFFLSLTRYCDRKRACEWLALRARNETEAHARTVLYRALTRCDAAIALPALEQPGTPDDAVVSLYFEAFEVDLPLSDRFVRAARNIAKARRGRQLRELAVAISRIKDDKVPAFVEQLQRELDPVSAAWLAIGLGASPSARGRQLYQHACSQPATRTDPLCTRPLTGVPVPVDAPTSDAAPLAELVLSGGFDARAWRRSHPGGTAALYDALRTCVAGGPEDFTRLRCLRTLEDLSWTEAREVALQLADEAFGPDPQVVEELAALRRFTSPEQVVEHLRALDLVPAEYNFVPEQQDGAPDIRTVLIEAGRLLAFDAETDQFPNEHDALLAELATLVAPDLADVRFEEVPPPDADEQRGTPYQLSAYAGGVRYTLHARDLGDWYDLDVVLGMLNSLLRERGSEQRVVSLATGDQTAYVLGGPESALRALVQDKLIVTALSLTARRHGKEAERKVFESLQKPGGR